MEQTFTEKVINIKQHTSICRTTNYCEPLITSENFNYIIFVAENKAVNKCISICEILKRKYRFLKEDGDLGVSDNGVEPKVVIKLYKEKQ